MKVIIAVLFLLLIAVVLYLGLSVKSVAPPEGLPVSVTTQVDSIPVPASSAAAPAAKPGAAAVPAAGAGKPTEGAVSGTVSDVKQAVDYATGYTPLKIKQRTEKKIQDANAAHNADMEKAINEE